MPGSVNVVARNPKLRSCWRLQGLTSASTAPTVRLFSSSAGQDIHRLRPGARQRRRQKADAEVTSTADQPREADHLRSDARGFFTLESPPAQRVRSSANSGRCDYPTQSPRWVRDGLSAKPFEGLLVTPNRTRGLRPTGGSSAVSCDGRGPNARGGTIIGQALDTLSAPNRQKYLARRRYELASRWRIVVGQFLYGVGPHARPAEPPSWPGRRVKRTTKSPVDRSSSA